jgi:hypothetical protein
VEYREPGGPRVSRTLTQADADVSINASKDDNVTVLFSGSDEQGVRQVELVYDMTFYSGNSISQPTLLPIKVDANCPKQSLFNTHKFEPSSSNYNYEFRSRATNWLNLATQTGKVTVHGQ